MLFVRVGKSPVFLSNCLNKDGVASDGSYRTLTSCSDGSYVKDYYWLNKNFDSNNYR